MANALKRWKKLILVLAGVLLSLAIIYFVIPRILFGIFFDVVTLEENQARYKKAKQDCESEIWFIVDDFGPTTAPVLRAPYPDTYNGDILLAYGCSQEERANNPKEF